MVERKNVDKELNSHTSLIRMQSGIATLKNSFVILYEVKQTLTTDPETPLLSIYPREMNTYIVLTKASIQVFTVDLFVITSSWKYPISFYEWRHKQIVVYQYNGTQLNSQRGKKITIDVLKNLENFWKHYAEWEKLVSKAQRKDEKKRPTTPDWWWQFS